jgi:chorismate mutase
MNTNIDDIFLPLENRPVLIAGPCAAESREQLVQTALALAGIPQLYAFRAGLWKPRTRPGNFEGVGKQGIDWLMEVKEKTGLRLAVEIAVPAHAEICLKAGIDIVWIGARTVVSPFIVDELANALQGSSICVMIKNPVNPDLKLWIGGVERLKKAGIKKLIAVHRGFDAYSKKPFRNTPLWEIPIEMKRLFPELPMLSDPSHIGGSRSLLSEISQKAIDLGMDGLMIESHIDPDHALTDVAQQISPAGLKKILSGLKIREHEGSETSVTLENYRSSIDELDEQLLELLSRRMEISELIGEYKKEQNLAPFQAKRWSAILEDRLKKGEPLKLDKEFISGIYNLIHKESLRRQGDVMNEGEIE